ncbi:uncharacterized protein LOC116415886 [Nasonia vitripennis]|uniref:DNA-directed DNA polymerase n=1 Tax=Nasonia vitripennis TaxID=7425 RepID=A0A7M7PX45_NASVI|nr:uncharacterized protein LOC116415886 [Nasonia vitripennis]
MQKRVGDKAKLLYTDTDSLIYEVSDVDMYAVMKTDLHEFDTSDYPVDNQFNIPLVNKKIVGLMKDECNGNIMTEFVGLCSKMYSVKVQGQQPIKKAKGVKSLVVKSTIEFDDYIHCLRDKATISRQQKNIHSRLHVIRTEKEHKIALSPLNDKRYLIPGQTDTLPWGHYMIDGYQLIEEDEPSAKRVRLH